MRSTSELSITQPDATTCDVVGWGPNTACIEWPHYRMPNGYGQRRYRGKTWLAHRAAWDEQVGPIPDGMFLCHRCDNPPCVNVDHLFLGTHQDNMDDMYAKERREAARGEKAGAAKLSWAVVAAIRAQHTAGAGQRELGRRYGVDHKTIGRVVHRKSWWPLPTGGGR